MRRLPSGHHTMYDVNIIPYISPENLVVSIRFQWHSDVGISKATSSSHELRSESGKSILSIGLVSYVSPKSLGQEPLMRRTLGPGDICIQSFLNWVLMTFRRWYLCFVNYISGIHETLQCIVISYVWFCWTPWLQVNYQWYLVFDGFPLLLGGVLVQAAW